MTAPLGRAVHQIRIIVLSLIGLIVSSATAFALNVNVTNFKLDNGLEVVVIPDRRAPVVTNMVWYRVGAADEPNGKSGIAHFLEHLLFKGTDQLQAGEFSKIVARNGGQDNAFTTHDFTGYYQRIAKDRLDLVMGLEANRMAHLQLTDEDIVPERAVVQEERRSRTDNDPSSLLSEQMSAALYVAHPYGRPVIGWMSEVQRLSRDDAMAFYREYYTPRNAIVVVAGDVSADEVRKLADKHFAPLKNTADPGPRLRTPEPEPIAARRIEMVDQRAANPMIQRTYLANGYNAKDEKSAFALELLANIIGSGPTSRLYRALVVDQKVAAFAGAWYDGEGLDDGSFGVYAAPVGGKTLAQVEAAIDQVLQEVIDKGVTEEELRLAKSSMHASTIYSLDSQFQLAFVFGSALATGKTVEDVLVWPDRIKQVTLDDVRLAARKTLVLKRSVTGLLRQKRQTASN